MLQEVRRKRRGRPDVADYERVVVVNDDACGGQSICLVLLILAVAALFGCGLWWSTWPHGRSLGERDGRDRFVPRARPFASHVLPTEPADPASYLIDATSVGEPVVVADTEETHTRIDTLRATRRALLAEHSTTVFTERPLDVAIARRLSEAASGDGGTVEASDEGSGSGETNATGGSDDSVYLSAYFGAVHLEKDLVRGYTSVVLGAPPDGASGAPSPAVEVEEVTTIAAGALSSLVGELDRIVAAEHALTQSALARADDGVVEDVPSLSSWRQLSIARPFGACNSATASYSPTVALLLDGVVVCSGTLVSPYLVVTAARCTYDSPLRWRTTLEVVRGHACADTPQRATVRAMSIPRQHREYPDEPLYDVAWLVLSTGFGEARAPTDPLEKRAFGHLEAWDVWANRGIRAVDRAYTTVGYSNVAPGTATNVQLVSTRGMRLDECADDIRGQSICADAEVTARQYGSGVYYNRVLLPAEVFRYADNQAAFQQRRRVNVLVAIVGEPSADTAAPMRATRLSDQWIEETLTYQRAECTSMVDDESAAHFASLHLCGVGVVGHECRAVSEGEERFKCSDRNGGDARFQCRHGTRHAPRSTTSVLRCQGADSMPTAALEQVGLPAPASATASFDDARFETWSASTAGD
jgi:hypothetical protein